MVEIRIQAQRGENGFVIVSEITILLISFCLFFKVSRNSCFSDHK